MNDTKAIAMRIEMYAREYFQEAQPEYGEFMYHAELINRGHWNVHTEDLQTMDPAYRDLIRSMYFEDPMMYMLKEWDSV